MSHWLSTLARRRRTLAGNEHLFHRGDRIRTMFLVESGSIVLARPGKGGRSLILQRACPGSVVAEASLFAAEYHCDAVAAEPTVVASLPRTDFLRRLDTSPEFARTWAMHLSREVRNARQRAEILSLRTVADKLDAWLAENGDMPEKGLWKNVAEEIGASPEALYREIARRRMPEATRGTRR